MQWLLDNWFLALLIGGMIGMHLFGHGGHGGHGGRRRRGTDDQDGAPGPNDDPGAARPHGNESLSAAPKDGTGPSTAAPARDTRDTDPTDRP